MATRRNGWATSRPTKRVAARTIALRCQNAKAHGLAVGAHGDGDHVILGFLQHVFVLVVDAAQGLSGPVVAVLLVDHPAWDSAGLLRRGR
jgi:hypothetical protein